MQYHKVMFFETGVPENARMEIAALQQLRRRNLNALIDRMGGQAEFVNKTGMNQGQASILQNGPRNIGEKLARKIESQCGIPPGSLDQPDGLNQDPMDSIERAINSASWLEQNDKIYFIGLLRSMRTRRR